VPVSSGIFGVFDVFSCDHQEGIKLAVWHAPVEGFGWLVKEDVRWPLTHVFFNFFFYFFSIFYNVFGIDGPQQMKELRGRFPTQCYVSCNACQATAACGAGTSHWTSLGPQRQPKTRVSHPVLALHRLHRALSFKAEDQLAAEDHRQPVQSYVWISNEQVILDHAYGRYHS